MEHCAERLKVGHSMAVIDGLIADWWKRTGSVGWTEHALVELRDAINDALEEGQLTKRDKRLLVPGREREVLERLSSVGLRLRALELEHAANRCMVEARWCRSIAERKHHDATHAERFWRGRGMLV